MVPPPPAEVQTAVQVTFPGTNLITGTLRDLRKRFEIDFLIPDSADKNKVVSAIAVVGLLDGTSITNTKALPLKKDGLTSIGTSTSVSSNDQVYEDSNGDSFQDSTHYSVRIKVTVQENGVFTHHNASFTLDGATTQSYVFFYRADGGDTFDNDNGNPNIENADAIENGSDIVINAPMNYVNSNDNRTPTSIVFNFDEVDDYDGTANDTNDSEELAPYSSIQVYRSDGRYTLENNELANDSTYLVTVTAIYSDGYITSTTIPDLNVIASPVIASVTAYGLGVNKDGAGDSTIESVMNVYLDELSNPVRMVPTSGNITFNLSQDGTVFYSANLPVSTDQQSDNTFLYTVLKSDLVKEWTTTAPVQNSNLSYTYDITAVIEYSTSAGPVTRTSNVVTKDFNDDINQLASVELVNAWVAACNVMGEGDRTVDYNNTTTAQGYDVAPGFGILVNFTKTDYFGSPITEGFFKNLDTSDTKFEIKISVNGGAYQAVQNLYMIQGDASKTRQQNVIDLLSLTSGSKQTNVNGVFPNIPGAAGVSGSAQPDMYVWIDEDELITRLDVAQGNGIKISVAIQPPTGQTTRPDATESNQVALLHKVNRYSMTLETDSEPTFTGSGSDGILSIPINNPTIPEGDLYFIKSIVTIKSYTPTEDNVQDVIDDGIYNHLIENPPNRGTSDVFKYELAFRISDPNGDGTITGPMSNEYQIYLKDEPTAANFTISNYEYKVFNDESVSSFTFDAQFQDVGNTSIDGLMGYFQYGEEEEVLVTKVERSDGNSQSNLTVTLTADSSSSSDGIYVKDIDGNAVSYLWPNFKDANILFKPYYTPKVHSSDDEPVVIDDPVTEPILNIPVIDLPADVSLTGGVLESYTGTVMAWTNDLDKYDGAGSITASFHLEKNNEDVTLSISNNDSFVIDLGNTPSTYTMDLSVKLASTVDDREFYSKSVVVVFDSVSVDMSGMTITTRRGSADINLKAEYVDYTTDPASAPNLNVTAVQLIDNPNGNVDPEDAGIRVLNCTSTEDAVQPPAPEINTYSIANDYILADEILARMRMEAGVDFTLQYGDDAASNEESTPLYLTLNGPVTSYIVGKRPEATVDGSSYVVPSSETYADQTAIPMKLDAKGLKKEGLLSVVVGLVKEHDHTDNNDTDDGAEIVLAFESSNGRLRSYTTQLDADTTTGSLDNLGANETHVLSVNDVDGFSESSSSGDFTLVTGSLDENDESVLYLPEDSEFVSAVLNCVVFITTRLGTDVTYAQVTPNPNPS
jgi:hypothetical protein